MIIKRFLIFTAALSTIGSLTAYAILSKPSAIGIDDGIVTTKMERIDADGSTTIIDPVEQEAWIVDKQFEIQNLLERQEYVSIAVVVLSRSESNAANLKFSIVMDGTELRDKVDEILSLLTQNIDRVDMADSYIMDRNGNCLYP